IFNGGGRDFSDAAHLLHDAHPGRWMGGADWGGMEEGAGPPPLKGGGCSIGGHSFFSFVTTPARQFLSGQNPPSFLFGPPFSLPILPMKAMPWNRTVETVRAARASALLPLGSRPSELSRTALRMRRLVSAIPFCPSVVPERSMKLSQNLRPL